MTHDARLSEIARDRLREAQSGGAQAVVPTIVLAEILKVIEKRNTHLTMPEVIERVVRTRGFVIRNFDMAVLARMLRLDPALELHDRIIAATALLFGAKVITRDRELTADIEPIWS